MKKQRSGWPFFWWFVGTVLSAVLVTATLASIAAAVLFVVAMNSYGSNK
jgi:hypothetical protein